MIVLDYTKRHIKEIIYSQAKSEGIIATFWEASEIIENTQAKISVRPFDVEVIINLKKAWKLMLNNLNNDLTIDFIKNINNLVSDSTNNHPGLIRTSKVYILDKNGQKWYPEIKQEKQISKELKRILKIENQLDQSLELLLYLSRSQIFENGNKRTAFLVSNKILIENNIGVLALPLEDSLTFKILLVDYYTNFNAETKMKIKKYLLEVCLNNYE